MKESTYVMYYYIYFYMDGKIRVFARPDLIFQNMFVGASLLFILIQSDEFDALVFQIPLQIFNGIQNKLPLCDRLNISIC